MRLTSLRRYSNVQPGTLKRLNHLRRRGRLLHSTRRKLGHFSDQMGDPDHAETSSWRRNLHVNSWDLFETFLWRLTGTQIKLTNLRGRNNVPTFLLFVKNLFEVERKKSRAFWEFNACSWIAREFSSCLHC